MTDAVRIKVVSVNLEETRIVEHSSQKVGYYSLLLRQKKGSLLALRLAKAKHCFLSLLVYGTQVDTLFTTKQRFF